jgi:limonene-1,2-epoxide hydrolase
MRPAYCKFIDGRGFLERSTFMAATQAGDLDALTRLLASDARVVTDCGGKVRSAQEVIDVWQPRRRASSVAAEQAGTV